MSLWAAGLWAPGLWAPGLWQEDAVSAEPESPQTLGGRAQRDVEERLRERVLDKWEAIDASRTPIHAVPRPVVTRAPRATPATRTVLPDGDSLSEHDTLALLIAVAHLDD